jgi:tRNA threonylcarbamoyladenosine biosynthesis protein TsaE
MDIGAEEYFYSGNYCFIEWPELVTELLPDDSIVVNIEIGQGEQERIFRF